MLAGRDCLLGGGFRAGAGGGSYEYHLKWERIELRETSRLGRLIKRNMRSAKVRSLVVHFFRSGSALPLMGRLMGLSVGCDVDCVAR